MIPLANWLIFRAWPSVRRWLWLLHRVALVAAFVLSLLAVLVTFCHHGAINRPGDIGAEPWTTRVWAADRAGGVTIRWLVVLVIVAMLALASTGATVVPDRLLHHAWWRAMALPSAASTVRP